jgi:SAM-dependent methyltransferase
MTGPASAIQADFDRLALLSQEQWDHNAHYHGFLLQQVPAGCGEALDIGCGTGTFARLLAGRAQHVLGLDLSPQMIRVARERAACLANVEFQVADVRQWRWPAARFDCVATIATMHHLPLAEMLARMQAALRPGGVLLVLDLFRGQGLADLVPGAAALPVSILLRLLHTGRLRQTRAVREAWAAHAPHDSYQTLAEIRRVCAEVLPGAQVHRHLLWRYSIVWRAAVRKLLRMERATTAGGIAPPAGIRIVPYCAALHQERIPTIYAGSFGEAPWPAGWDRFDEFDPQGVFVGIADGTQEAAGVVICFRRRYFGYISVVAVLPAYQRRGIASALVGTAIDYLRSLGLDTVRIDAYEQSVPAVRTYEKLGFRVTDVLCE